MNPPNELDKDIFSTFFHKKTAKEVYRKIEDAAIKKNECKYDKRFMAGFCSGILISAFSFAFYIFERLTKEENNFWGVAGLFTGILVAGLSGFLRASHPTSCLKKENIEEKTILAFRTLSEEDVKIFSKQACEELDIPMTSEEINEFSTFLYNYIQDPDHLDELNYLNDDDDDSDSNSDNESSALLNTP